MPKRIMEAVKPRTRIVGIPKTLSVMPTFACPAECASCGTLSGPKDPNKLTFETIRQGIDEAAELEFLNVVFTGGEPTLQWNHLVQAIAYAREKRLLTRLVTNAHWARSYETALKKATILAEAGLDEINFSTGDEHARFIPLEHVIHAIAVFKKIGYVPGLMIELKTGRDLSKEKLLAHPLFLEYGLCDEDVIISESPWMPLDPFDDTTYRQKITANSENIHNYEGCDSILQTYVLQANGSIGSCCGLGMRIIPELQVANIRDNEFLSKAVDEGEQDIMKLLLKYMGPEKLLHWAAGKDKTIKWEDMYAHKCQACLRLYSDEQITDTILEHYEELLPDLLSTMYIEEVMVKEKMKAD